MAIFCQAFIIQFTGKMEDKLFTKLDEQKYQINRLQSLNRIAYSRIDELHNTIQELEQRMKVIIKELHNVRQFSIDMLNDYSKTIQQEYDKKLEAEQRAAQEYAYQMENHYREMVEYQEYLFTDTESDDNWRLLMQYIDETEYSPNDFS